MATNSIKLLTGSSHPQLAKLVADRLGIELAKTMSLNYSNQETSVTVGESVRDEDGTFSPSPPNGARFPSNTNQYSFCSPLPLAISTMVSWNS